MTMLSSNQVVVRVGFFNYAYLFIQKTGFVDFGIFTLPWKTNIDQFVKLQILNQTKKKKQS